MTARFQKLNGFPQCAARGPRFPGSSTVQVTRVRSPGATCHEHCLDLDCLVDHAAWSPLPFAKIFCFRFFILKADITNFEISESFAKWIFFPLVICLTNVRNQYPLISVVTYTNVVRDERIVC